MLSHRRIIATWLQAGRIVQQCTTVLMAAPMKQREKKKTLRFFLKLHLIRLSVILTLNGERDNIKANIV